MTFIRIAWPSISRKSRGLTIALGTGSTINGLSVLSYKESTLASMLICIIPILELPPSGLLVAR
jgi:hypothetical protein